MAKNQDINNVLKILRVAGVNKRSWLYFLVLIVLVLFYTFNATKIPLPGSANSNSSNSSEFEEAHVVKVIDGDTIEVEDGPQKVTVRYIGMDTPETVKPNTEVQCFGKEASEKNKSLVYGKPVFLEKDVQDVDRYGRTLRYVYLKNEDGSMTMVNKLLVEEGYAHAASFPPNVKYQDLFRDTQTKAREEKKGLWEKCGS
jgi:micrococcal nuclease